MSDSLRDAWGNTSKSAFPEKLKSDIFTHLLAKEREAVTDCAPSTHEALVAWIGWLESALFDAYNRKDG